MNTNDLTTRFDSVVERIHRALEKSGRQPTEVRLMAVSKWHPAQAVATVAGHWSTCTDALGGVLPLFGESYTAEALEKMPAVANLLGATIQPEWHFIGHIQSRKAHEMAGVCSLIHSVDSVKLATKIAAFLPIGGAQPILIQVNIGLEEQKSGILPDKLEELLIGLQQLPTLQVQGLMCLPPFFDDAEKTRPYFIQMRELRDAMQQKTGILLPHLSMGMSQDMDVAIEEGATFIRIGTDIFGPREY